MTLDRVGSGVYIGTAGWSIPSSMKDRFPREGTSLQRYAALFTAAEITASFHRPQRPSTYERWAASVPEGFRFAIKIPKAITHASRLIRATGSLERFLNETSSLGQAMGPVLVQLPPSLVFGAPVAAAFFFELRSRFTGSVVCEPRHASWFTPEADGLLESYNVARVAADPAPEPGAERPGGWSGIAYYRLHGSPRVYYSSYSRDYLDSLAVALTAPHPNRECWCIFDNTASGAAAANAAELLKNVNARLRYTPSAGARNPDKQL